MNLKEQYEAAARAVCHIYTFLDMRIDSIENGVYRSKIPLSVNTKNHVNIMHAGPIWMAAEYLGGLVAFHNLSDSKYQPVVAGVTIKFLRPATSDITAETIFSDEDAKLMRKSLLTVGRFDFSIHIVLRDSVGKIVAEADGDYVVKDFSNLM
ncbi:MAG: hypothetical protein CMK36_04365 [Porticoccaceae bacterium]|nr:hypothetical protein [Porticoccaceae bacterium]|tara:strand:- start:8936 stop:9391 length:456 start_codon:yes stop_codon:yes gene_type:complete